MVGVPGTLEQPHLHFVMVSAFAVVGGVVVGLLKLCSPPFIMEFRGFLFNFEGR
jgi:hypothetical protein